jgi:hypothetical protein
MKTKEELIEKFKKNAGTMSYFNAAEGSWSSERAAREAHRKIFRETARQLLELGLTEEDLDNIASGYLTCSSDYIDRTAK